MKLMLLLLVYVSTCEANKNYARMWNIYRTAIDSRKTSRDLRRCWVDTSGECCRKNVADCKTYRRYRKTRANYFFINTVPFQPGNFTFSGCNVQCLCGAPQPSCSGGGQPPATYGPPVTNPPVRPPTTGAPVTPAPPVTQAPTRPPATQAPTTPAPTSTAAAFCPSEATTKPTAGRILGGTPVNDCTTYPGIVSIVDTTDQKTVCTGVVTSSMTIDMPSNCAQLMTVPLEIQIPSTGKVIDTLPTIDTSTVPTGGPYTITLASPLTSSSCPGIACVYAPTMLDVIDLDKCVVVGSGYKDTAGSGTASVSFMKVPSLQPTADCPSLLTASDQAALFDTTLTYNCFYGGKSSTCSGDVGAPVMCPLTTGEVVVIGQTENIPCKGTEIVGFFNLEAAATRVLRIDPLRIKFGAINNRKKDVLLGGINTDRDSLRLNSKTDREEIDLNSGNIKSRSKSASRKSQINFNSGSRKNKISFNSGIKSDVRLGTSVEKSKINLNAPSSNDIVLGNGHWKRGMSNSKGIILGLSSRRNGINISEGKKSGVVLGSSDISRRIDLSARNKDLNVVLGESSQIRENLDSDLKRELNLGVKLKTKRGKSSDVLLGVKQQQKIRLG